MFKGKVCAVAVGVLILAAAGRAEFQVNTYTTYHQTHPAVAMNEAGEFIVAWRSHPTDGRGGGVYARCFRADGTPVGQEFKVNTSEADVDNWTPAVAIAPSGNCIVAWVTAKDGDCDIAARMFNRQGQPLTEEFAVNASSPPAAQSMPSIAMNSAGDFVIVWTSWSGVCYIGSSYVLGRMYRADATPRGEEFLIGAHSNADWPDVVMENSGGFIVTWIRMGDTYNRPYGEYIMYRRFNADGTPAGGAVQVTGDLNSRWYGPSVAVDRSGEFAITWAAGPFPYDIVAQRFGPDGTPVTEPSAVNTCLKGNQGRPRIATNGEGQYLVVWDSQDQDGSGCGVFGQRYARGGQIVGAERLINTYVLDRQWYPRVAMGAGDKCVVVWISENQDGSGYGIFGELGIE